jgi:hypothetical protein
MPEEHAAIPPLSVTCPAEAPAHTVSPKVTALEALQGTSPAIAMVIGEEVMLIEHPMMLVGLAEQS